VKQLILCPFLVLAGCKDQRPPAPTVEQSQELNETENMLDNMSANEEGPEQSPGPSNSND
jgi:hypothetical protein